MCSISAQAQRIPLHHTLAASCCLALHVVSVARVPMLTYFRSQAPYAQVTTAVCPLLVFLSCIASQGALLCLAAATVGLGEPSEAHLRQIVPPVLASFTDQDSRVRYYACEALYNIAKVRRTS